MLKANSENSCESQPANGQPIISLISMKISMKISKISINSNNQLAIMKISIINNVMAQYRIVIIMANQ